MAQTYAALQQQIARLQERAEAAKSREVGDVITKIKEAIAFYNLKPRDLFGAAPAAAKGNGARKPRKKQAAKRVKYRDENGNTWVGRGKHPDWVREALAQGRKLEDFLV
jgi:DNA-binding protein H-NS